MAVTRRIFLAGTAATVAAGALATGPTAGAVAVAPVASASAADATLDRALARLVAHADGPPGAIAVVQRGQRKLVHRAGTADLATRAPMQPAD